MSKKRSNSNEFVSYAHDLRDDLAPHGIKFPDFTNVNEPNNTRLTTLLATQAIVYAIAYRSLYAEPTTLDMPTYKTTYGKAMHGFTQQHSVRDETGYNFACPDAEPYFTLFAKAVKWRRIHSPVILFHDNTPIGIMKGIPGSYGERTILGIGNETQTDSPIHPSAIVEGNKTTAKLLKEIQKSSRLPHVVHLENLLYAQGNPADVSITGLFNAIRLSAYSDPTAMRAMQSLRRSTELRLSTKLLPPDDIREITVKALRKGKVHEPTEKEIKKTLDRI